MRDNKVEKSRLIPATWDSLQLAHESKHYCMSILEFRQSKCSGQESNLQPCAQPECHSCSCFY